MHAIAGINKLTLYLEQVVCQFGQLCHNKKQQSATVEHLKRHRNVH